MPRRRRKLHKNKKFKHLKPLFYTDAWKRLRYSVLKRDGGRCQLCGRSSHDGVVLNVDHIKNLRDHPKLAMDPSNLQTLCSGCNWGKGNSDSTDWRLDQQDLDNRLRGLIDGDTH